MSSNADYLEIVYSFPKNLHSDIGSQTNSGIFEVSNLAEIWLLEQSLSKIDLLLPAPYGHASCQVFSSVISSHLLSMFFKCFPKTKWDKVSHTNIDNFTSRKLYSILSIFVSTLNAYIAATLKILQIVFKMASSNGIAWVEEFPPFLRSFHLIYSTWN